MLKRSYVSQLIIGLLLALLIFSLLGKISPFLVMILNPFTWIVLYFSLVRHEVFGAVTGTICGLLQDTFSLGVFGVAGLTKTLLGFGAGLVSRKINVLPPGRNFVFVLVMAAIELVLWKAMVMFLFSEGLGIGGGWLLLQPLTTALVVTISFQAMGRKEEEVA